MGTLQRILKIIMKLNTPLKLALLSAISCSFAYNAYAANDTSVINISHTYTPFVNFTGTAPGASRFYDNDALVNFVFPLSVNLGTMGLESNISGNCDLDFTTVNDFQLLHTVTSNSLGDYSIQYQGQEFNQASNPQLELPCTSAATNLNFILTGVSFSGFDFFIEDGVYQDIISVVVTTQ